ncbi:MAG: hypothetical protein WC453_04805 [Patescibacteria group bacterium]
MKYLRLAISALSLSVLLLAPAQAALINQDKFGEFDDNVKIVASSSDYKTNTSLESMIATVIRLVLSVLGLIFILLMFLAGNDWIQAAGNEEKVKKSKDTIRNLVIGLALTVIAYALASGFSRVISSVVLTK